MAVREDFAHLLRRATFGPTADEVDAAERAGYASTVDSLVSPVGVDRGAAATPMPVYAAQPPMVLPSNPTEEQKKAADEARKAADEARKKALEDIPGWWLNRMVAAQHQFSEKLVFFWHGHWATNVDKINNARLMLMQQDVFRRYGAGDFTTFTKQMVRDPALILWLDGQKNTRKAPNENLGRELMELFTLGVGSYTEDDVKGAAKALTGWTVDANLGKATFDPRRHESGNITLFGVTGKYDVDRACEAIINQPTHPMFIVRRLWFRFGSEIPLPDDVHREFAAAYLASGRNISQLMKTIFNNPTFQAPRGELAKQPIEWAVGAMRQLKINPVNLGEGPIKALREGFNRWNQVLFKPPSVGGWPHGAAWLTTVSVLIRMQMADQLAAVAGKQVVDTLNAAPVAGRADALARLLVVDRWTPRTRAQLDAVAKDARKLISLGLTSPEYSVH
jgi:uncharacterized protein (DUF1800 family)